MTWIKLEDKTPRHPKIAGLSDRAFRAWIGSLCYASEFLTDGAIPSAFLITVKPKIHQELIGAGLWKQAVDGSGRVVIHDYLEHQTARESVERERRRNRERRRGERRDEGGRTAGTTAGTPAEKPRPESREQIQRTDTEIRVQSGRPAALIMSPLAYERRKQQCAYVGARLEVPHQLHGELRKLLGGLNAETDLLAWYADLDAEIEVSGEAIVPDVFRWLKAKFAAWAEKTNDSVAATVARIEAKQAARKVGVS